MSHQPEPAFINQLGDHCLCLCGLKHCRTKSGRFLLHSYADNKTDCGDKHGAVEVVKVTVFALFCYFGQFSNYDDCEETPIYEKICWQHKCVSFISSRLLWQPPLWQILTDHFCLRSANAVRFKNSLNVFNTQVAYGITGFESISVQFEVQLGFKKI